MPIHLRSVHKLENIRLHVKQYVTDFIWVLQSVLVSVFYSKPQRLDVYVDNSLVAPTNAQWNNNNTDYTLKKPVSAGINAHRRHSS